VIESGTIYVMDRGTIMCDGSWYGLCGTIDHVIFFKHMIH
jgi:hypothetical protein